MGKTFKDSGFKKDWRNRKPNKNKKKFGKPRVSGERPPREELAEKSEDFFEN